jgi:hypothetical protein
MRRGMRRKLTEAGELRDDRVAHLTDAELYGNIEITARSLPLAHCAGL